METSSPDLQSPQENDSAWALLSLKEANNSSEVSTPSSTASTSKPNLRPALAKIWGKEFECLMRQDRILIGRNSSTRGEVDINLGHSTFVSRKHMEIYHEDGNFYLICYGKNGVFVGGASQSKGAAPMQLPRT